MSDEAGNTAVCQAQLVILGVGKREAVREERYGIKTVTSDTVTYRVEQDGSVTELSRETGDIVKINSRGLPAPPRWNRKRGRSSRNLQPPGRRSWALSTIAGPRKGWPSFAGRSPLSDCHSAGNGNRLHRPIQPSKPVAGYPGAP